MFTISVYVQMLHAWRLRPPICVEKKGSCARGREARAVGTVTKRVTLFIVVEQYISCVLISSTFDVAAHLQA